MSFFIRKGKRYLKKLKKKWSKPKRMGAFITMSGKTFPISLKDKRETCLMFTRLKMSMYLQMVH